MAANAVSLINYSTPNTNKFLSIPIPVDGGSLEYICNIPAGHSFVLLCRPPTGLVVCLVVRPVDVLRQRIFQSPGAGSDGVGQLAHTAGTMTPGSLVWRPKEGGPGLCGGVDVLAGVQGIADALDVGLAVESEKCQHWTPCNSV